MEIFGDTCIECLYSIYYKMQIIMFLVSSAKLLALSTWVALGRPAPPYPFAIIVRAVEFLETPGLHIIRRLKQHGVERKLNPAGGSLRTSIRTEIGACLRPGHLEGECSCSY